MKYFRFGTVQIRIMRILWEKGQGTTAKEITKQLNSASEIAHSTVQTLLRQLENKGAVAHKKKHRTFVFYSLVSWEEAVQNELKRLIVSLFQGSEERFFAYILKQGKIKSQELSEIKSMIRGREIR